MHTVEIVFVVKRQPPCDIVQVPIPQVAAESARNQLEIGGQPGDFAAGPPGDGARPLGL